MGEEVNTILPLACHSGPEEKDESHCTATSQQGRTGPWAEVEPEGKSPDECTKVLPCCSALRLHGVQAYPSMPMPRLLLGVEGKGIPHCYDPGGREGGPGLQGTAVRAKNVFLGGGKAGQAMSTCELKLQVPDLYMFHCYTGFQFMKTISNLIFKIISLL